MRPVEVSVSSAASSAVVPLDIYNDPFNVSVAAVFSAGAAMTYTVEHTYDDPFAATFDASTATWFPNSGLTAKTASAEGNYVLPVRAIRLRVTAYTQGSVTMKVIQAGILGGN